MKRLRTTLALLAVLSTALLAATASDDFNRANESPLGGNWTSQNDSFPNLANNRIEGALGNGRQDVYWNAATFSANQFSQVQVVTVSSGTQFVYAYVRMADNPTETRYALRTDGATTIIFRIVTGTQTQLQDTSTTTTSGDTIRLSVVGTTLKAYKNGSQIGTDQTDANIASGRPGFGVFETAILDNWSGGDVAINAWMSLLGAGR